MPWRGSYPAIHCYPCYFCLAFGTFCGHSWLCVKQKSHGKPTPFRVPTVMQEIWLQAMCMEAHSRNEPHRVNWKGSWTNFFCGTWWIPSRFVSRINDWSEVGFNFRNHLEASESSYFTYISGDFQRFFWWFSLSLSPYHCAFYIFSICSPWN